jgi:LmbE family N-acetylglucosaminyl deacetylase
LYYLFAAICLWTVFPAGYGAEVPPFGSAILQDLKGFREMGSVLHVAAHPDDENTQLLTYLSRGRNYRTAYLSLTRGDGGQNLLGPEFGEQLGVARTQELLAARRLDGGRQFFTRALDFGFSKDYRETLNVWDHQQVLADIVQVIRSFRPDVLITRFSPQPSGTHGHHTASAYLALEAFKLAGDPNAFPEQLKALTPWQPKRILMNGGGPGRGAAATNTAVLRIEVGGNDPVSGESFGAIAGRSRAMHKTQGFGNFGGGGGGARSESFQLLDGVPAVTDIFDGVDTTWGRVPGGAEIGKLADEAIAQFKPENPSATVPVLLALRSRLASLAADPLVDDKRRQLDRLLAACLGLAVETSVAQVEAVPGEMLSLSHTAKVRSSIPVRWKEVRYPENGGKMSVAVNLQTDQPVSQT